MEKVNLITYADANYLQHACVLLLSLKDVASASREYRVFVFYSSCSASHLKKFRRTLDRQLPPNITYELQECDYGLESRLQAKSEHLSASIYNKLFIYNELPQEMQKVLFLDADIVLLRDPAELYDLNLKMQTVAAVRETVFEILPEKAQEAIGVDKKNYFNSGVMLINLNKWRELGIADKALDFCIEKWGETPYHDQDGLNHTINGDWLEISPLWNPRTKNRLLDPLGKERYLSKNEIYEEKLSYLVHYSGPGKPWFYMSFHPRKKLYLDYLRQSEFRDYRFPDYSPANLVKRQILRFRRKVYYLRKGVAL